MDGVLAHFTFAGASNRVSFMRAKNKRFRDVSICALIISPSFTACTRLGYTPTIEIPATQAGQGRRGRGRLFDLKSPVDVVNCTAIRDHVPGKLPLATEDVF